jgi:hypothetical protein
VAIVLETDKALRGLIQMIIGPDIVLVRDLGQKLDILEVGSAYVDVEEDQVSILLLALHQISELGFDFEKGLGKPFSRSDTVHGQIDRSNTRSPDLVDEGPVQKIAICREIYEESLFGTVTCHLDDEVLSHEGFPAHNGDHPATQGLEPV